MRKYGLSVLFLAVLDLAISLACGSSPAPRALQSVSLSPPTADDQGSPVQFTATGYFNDQPSSVKLSSANWGACYQNQRTTAVLVNTDGLAQCAAGAVGTYTVWAWAESAGAPAAATTARSLRTLAAEPANANLQVPRS